MGSVMPTLIFLLSAMLLDWVSRCNFCGEDGRKIDHDNHFRVRCKDISMLSMESEYYLLGRKYVVLDSSPNIKYSHLMFMINQ